MITAKNLTKKYINDVILDNVYFVLGNHKKIGLVGKNGCGKTTLFKVITGQEDYEGSLVLETERLGYIPQQFDFPNQLVGEYLEQFLQDSWEFYKVDSLATQLKFSNFDIYQQIHTLSEGQKMKLKLIEILLQDPTTLLIDEPTNHLDITGILWFENYIKNLNLTVIMISHDREFLNHTVDEIWEIENKKLIKYVGDYDNYKEEKLKLIDKWNEEYVRFVKHKQKLEKLLASTKTRLAGAKTGRAIRAIKTRIDREITQNEKTEYVNKKVRSFDLQSDIHSRKLILRTQNLTKKFEDKVVFQNINLELRGKDKAWLFGPNGAGKSTLVKIIMNQLQQTSGDILVGNNLNIGYFSQVQKNEKIDETLIDYFTQQTNTDHYSAYSKLERFMFTKQQFPKRIWQLSPGERSRFNLAIFTSKQYDFLIMDEPDNHLDIDTKEALEKSLREYEGTLLLISHDRYFVESIGINKVLNLQNGSLKVL